MEDLNTLLELLHRPAFFVCDGLITRVNRDAARYMLEEGTPVSSLIDAGQEEYGSFVDGYMCLTLLIGQERFLCSVFPHTGGHIFMIEQQTLELHLQCMALVAQQLRSPLTGILAAADRLLPRTEEFPAQEYANHMNQRLYQLLRMVGNMSDAARYANPQPLTEYADVPSLLAEVFEQAIPLAESCGYHLQYDGIPHTIHTLAEQELLERAVLNLLSNAIKFSPEGSTLHARLTKHGNFLRFTMEDPGCGMRVDSLGSPFCRYMREPSLEDPRHGLGLGLVMVQLAAACHGGAVLIDQPHGTGTRVTMTIAIQHHRANTVRTPVLRFDYTGERNHALIELADVLPSCLYTNETIR